MTDMYVAFKGVCGSWIDKLINCLIGWNESYNAKMRLVGL